MNPSWKSGLWSQFGASIDMLENAVQACPDELWGDRARNPQVWYVVYHTLFFLDYYLSNVEEDDFVPPAPFKFAEMDIPVADLECAYTRAEMQAYLDHCRAKCRTAIDALTDDQACQHCGIASRHLTVFELMLYNMRHVQHHAAQLNLILRQTIDSAPSWVGKTKIALAVE